MPITFDQTTGRFRDANGRFVAASRIHHEINKTVNKLEKDLRLISNQLNQGKIDLAEWKIQAAEKLKTAHLLASAIGTGGRKRMTASDWGKAGVAIREQYKFLNNFAKEIELGKLSSNKIAFRSASYAKAIRETFYKQEIELKKEAGFLFCRRIQHAAESCPACSTWAAKGFIPISEMPPIGSLICRGFCKCELEYSRTNSDIFGMTDVNKLAEELGFATVDIDEQSENKPDIEFIYSYILQGLQDLKANYPNFQMPRKLVFSTTPPNKDYRAWYNKSEQSLNINTNHYVWKDPEYWMLEEGEKIYSTKNKHHIVRHEYGHHYHQLLSPEALNKIKLSTEERRLILQKVSIYALQDSSEFVAEVFTALLDGKTFDDDVMELYNYYGGVEPE